MWFSSSVEMACAYSVFSLAMRVRLLISGLLFILRSCRASRKSAATSAAGSDMMGSRMCTLGKGVRVRRELQSRRMPCSRRTADPSRPFSQTKQTDASSLSNTRCDRMFVLLLATTSLGYAARRLRQDSQDSDKTRSPPATALHPLRAFLRYSPTNVK